MKVSLITATFNSSLYIEDAIQSVIGQTCFTDIEFIIIDGGSTDGTLNILKKYEKFISFQISEKDNGIYDALNKGITYSTTEIIGFLHSDDVLAHPNVVSNILDKFNNNALLSGVYGDLLYVGKNNLDSTIRKWKSSKFSYFKLFFGWMPPHPTLYVKKCCYEKINLFSLDYKISADYYSILLMFSNRSFVAEYLPEVLVKMRVGGVSNRSLLNIITKTCEDVDCVNKAILHTPFSLITVFLKNISKLKQFF